MSVTEMRIPRMQALRLTLAGQESGVTPPDSWQYSTEHVLFGRIGHLRLLKNGLRLAFEAPDGPPGEKPDGFYTERVIPASPEPRLEMFARQAREGFVRWRAGDAPMR